MKNLIALLIVLVYCVLDTQAQNDSLFSFDQTMNNKQIIKAMEDAGYRPAAEEEFVDFWRRNSDEVLLSHLCKEPKSPVLDGWERLPPHLKEKAMSGCRYNPGGIVGLGLTSGGWCETCSFALMNDPAGNLRGKYVVKGTFLNKSSWSPAYKFLGVKQ